MRKTDVVAMTGLCVAMINTYFVRKAFLDETIYENYTPLLLQYAAYLAYVICRARYLNEPHKKWPFRFIESPYFLAAYGFLYIGEALIISLPSHLAEYYRSVEYFPPDPKAYVHHLTATYEFHKITFMLPVTFLVLVGTAITFCRSPNHAAPASHPHIV